MRKWPLPWIRAPRPFGWGMAILAASTVLGLNPLRSPAQAEDTFFAGRNLTLNIGYGTGGGYDVSGRVVARATLASTSPNDPRLL